MQPVTVITNKPRYLIFTQAQPFRTINRLRKQEEANEQE